MDIQEYGRLVWQLRKVVCQVLGIPARKYKKGSVVEELVSRTAELVLSQLDRPISSFSEADIAEVNAIFDQLEARTNEVQEKRLAAARKIVEAPTMEPKRRRGRPRSKPVEAAVAENSPKRRPGRPKKVA